MQKYQNNVQTTKGTAIRGASVFVYKADGSLASLYRDNGITPMGNPVVTDADGEYSFYVENGRYSLTVIAAGYVIDKITDFSVQDVGDLLSAATLALSAAQLAVLGVQDDLAAVASSVNIAVDSSQAAQVSALAALGHSADAAESEYNAAQSKLATERFYPGSYATDPLLRPDGTARQVGDMAFSSSAAVWKRWSGSAWIASDLNPGALAASGGAALIGTQLNAVGAQTLTVSERFSNLISLFEFMTNAQITDYKSGAMTLDLTTVVQAALTATRFNGTPTNAGKVLQWPAGRPKITAALTVGSRQRCWFDSNCIVDATGLPNESTSLFVASNQSEVYFEGNGAQLIGARATANAAVEGSQSGFYIYGCDNVKISNFRIYDFATDGITITGDNTGSGPCTNVLIENCFVNNSRRNGLSIISAIGCTVIGGEYSNSNGGPGGPWAGIDVEPNVNCFLQAVTLLNVRTSNNPGGGVLIVPGALSVAGAASKTFEVHVIGGRSLHDGDTNAVNMPALSFACGGTQLNKIYGQVKIDGFIVDSPKGRGVSWWNWDADKCPRIILDDVVVYDPDYNSGASTNSNRTAFVAHAASTMAITNLGNILMRNCRAVDRRATARMSWGALLWADAGKVLKNVQVENPATENMVATGGFDVYTAIAEGAGTGINVDVVYATPQPFTTAASINLAAYGGKRIKATTSGSVYTLPLAANCQGMHYEVQCAPGINSVQVTANAADTIAWGGITAGGTLVLDVGGLVSLRSQGGTTWQVEVTAGIVRRGGTSSPANTSWAIAAPASGAYNRGDRAINALPAVGQPKAWTCTVSGTPGTWVSEGNL